MRTNAIYTSKGSYVFMIEGLEDLGSLDDLKPQIVQAAHQAINRTLDRARTASAREIRKQVNFPAAYLQGEDSRLSVTQRASSSRLEGVITGRRRATSLARFVVGSSRGKGVSVKVKPDKVETMKRAFLMKLRAGNASIDTKSNLGLAVRTRDGKKPSAAYKPVKIGENLYLLYGPSVDQVFRTVREDVAKDTQEFLNREFNRLLDLRL
ncbi:phage tail protein [Neoaquamicrobium sediminum]|uniref:phage tail protein n=1 Tax=Neoaquamicrobium sediminum TaxID=1849104 RepID=UPI00156442AC|nr:phage tail protein [Mesorhizobium sediminum]NRC54123.1 hypothetical protein [Mesorhizobium sediminum]